MCGNGPVLSTTEIHTLVVARRSGVCAIALDGVQAFPLLPMVGSIEKIAFRPWRNKFEVYDFYLTEMTQDVPLGAAAASAELADGAKAATREEVPLLDTKFNWPYDPLAPSKIQQWENAAAAAYQPGELIVALEDFTSSSDPRAGQRASIDVAKGDRGRVIRSDPVYGVFVLFAKDPSRDHQISPELFDKVQKAPELFDDIQKEAAAPPPEAPQGAAGAPAASAAVPQEPQASAPQADAAGCEFVVSSEEDFLEKLRELGEDADVTKLVSVRGHTLSMVDGPSPEDYPMTVTFFVPERAPTRGGH